MGMHGWGDITDVYQWVIDDVIAKSQKNFSKEGIADAVLHELAEVWENRILDMNICEKLGTSGRSKSVLEPKIRSPFSEQHAVPLTLGQFSHTTIQSVHDKSYYNIACNQYAVTAQTIQQKTVGIVNISSPIYSYCPDNNSTLLQKPLLGNLHSTKEFVNETAGFNHDAQLHSVLSCDMEKRKKRELSYNRNSKVWTSTEKLKKEHLSSNLSEHLKSQTHLQSEELSELSESGSDEEFFNAHDDVDKINCCYERIQLRRKGKQTKWLNTLKYGIASIGGKEYAFHSATADLEWDT